MPGFEVQVLYHDHALQLASWEDLFIQRWIGEGTAEHVERMIDAHRRFISAHPPKSTLALSHVDTTSIRPPDDRSRAAMHRHTELIGPGIRAIATVISAPGFSGAMVRGIVAGLMLLTRGEAAHKVVGTTREAFAFLRAHRLPARGALDADRLEAMYVGMRRRDS